MKYSALLALTALTGLVLGGCMGPEGNPDAQPYATDPGGAIAAAPATNGMVAYNPESQAPQSADSSTVMGLPPVTPTPQPAPVRQ